MRDHNNGIFDPVNHDLVAGDLRLDGFDTFLDNLTDVPASAPLHPFTINKAGIVNQEVYVKIKSLFSREYVPVYCRISMRVELKGHRGIHMSRCEEALFELVEDRHESLDAFTAKLAKEIRQRQESTIAYVKTEGWYIAERRTLKTKQKSLDKLILTADARADEKSTTIKIGVKAFNMTGCPCTETYTKFSIVPKLEKQGFDLDQIKSIIATTNSGTHTQRGVASIVIDKGHIAITHSSLYEVLNQSCHLVFELLKRPDEHELVLRALKKPQFTEDVVREIIHNTLKVFKELGPDVRICATSLLYDSIHIHDVYTKIDKTVGELREEL